MSDLSKYHDIIARKKVLFEPHGIKIKDSELIRGLFDYQAHCATFALNAGCSGLYLDTGMGKTITSQSWAQIIIRRTNKPVLQLAPLGVASQHVMEAERVGIEAKYSRTGACPSSPILTITNYERLERFDPEDYAGVIFDEASIVKSYSGATTRKLMEAFKYMPFRLACSATPAPNDHMELGQQCQLLGVMNSNEMLSRWFIADQTNMGRYRIKRAAVNPFWDWVASWARCASKPSDLGFSDKGFEMPELIQFRHEIMTDRSVESGEENDGQMRLIRLPSTSATSIHKEKRLTCNGRAELIAGLIEKEPDETWLIWCDTDYEAEALKRHVRGCIEVNGKQSADEKEELLMAFSTGKEKRLITKPKIAGQGLNWQHCARMAFVGLSFSYESYYQAVRRCWRFGQKRPVHVHIACSDTESAIWNIVSRKSGDHEVMKEAMTAAMLRTMNKSHTMHAYNPNIEASLPAWL